MIEVLVTMVILSVGLLGMAAMQFTGIRSASGSSYRTQATILVDDMVERMRANPAAVNAGNSFMAVDSAANIDCATVPATYCAEYFDGTDNIDAQTCTGAQMATYDINVWFCGISNSNVRQGGVQAILPQATASITCTDTNPPSGADGDVCTDQSPHTITVGWTEPNPQRGGAATIQQSVVITIQP